METTKSKTKEFNINDFCDAVITNGAIDQKRVSLLNELFKNKGEATSGKRSRFYSFEFEVEIGNVDRAQSKKKHFELIIGSDSINNRYKFGFFKKGNKVKYDKIIEDCLETASSGDSSLPTTKNETLPRSEMKKRKQLLFIRCLHDYLLKKESETARNYFNFNFNILENCLINPNGERISDRKLLKIVFYDEGIIDSQENEDVIERLLRDNNITIHKTNNEEQVITNTFVRQLLCHPLFYYLLNRKNSSGNDFSEPKLIKFLIDECVVLHNDKLLFLPFSEALIARERKICFTKLATQSSVDPSLFFDRISKLAYSVSKGKGEISFGKEKIEDFCKSKSGTVWKFFNFLTTFLDTDGEKYKFKSKITRLFFCAHYLAKKFNAYTFFDDLIDCCLAVKKTDGQTQTDSLVDIDEDGFDTLIILSGLVLHMIPETDKNSFLMYLANNPAKDYKVQSRKKQIAAIAIITYAALFEWSLFKGDTRKTLFEAAFGQTEYSFQIKAAENLLQNDFYKEAIKDCLANLGENETNVKPCYFYYYHHFPDQFVFSKNRSDIEIGFISEKIFFDVFKPFKFRRDTHIAEFEEKEFSEFVKDTFSQEYHLTYKAELIISKLKNLGKTIDRGTVFLLYSCQALLISIANYERKKSRIFSNDENGKNAEGLLLKLAIYCDYFSRLINTDYQNSKEKANTDYFLLCGPFRISCLRKFEARVEIKDENLKRIMEENYQKWLEQETGRYKILLLRLLAYTDLNINLDELPAVTQEDFLDYDNIDAFKIQQDKRAKEEKGEYIFDPLKWYKND